LAIFVPSPLGKTPSLIDTQVADNVRHVEPTIATDIGDRCTSTIVDAATVAAVTPVDDAAPFMITKYYSDARPKNSI
jgi:hypothetical protein